MTDHTASFPGDLPADEMGEYLRLYLDETDEQLDSLIQTLLALETEPADAAGLNEAFRLIHSIKGSSALLGLDRITTLTHHLESHFERLRSGRRLLDAATMNVVLRCIDFLRQCNDHLRKSEPLDSAGDLLDQVKALEHSAETQPAARPDRQAAERPVDRSPAAEISDGDTAQASAAIDSHWRISLRFAPSLPMAEMKAELILTRLAGLGTITDLAPPRSSMAELAELHGFEVVLASPAGREAMLAATHADGVEGCDIEQVPAGSQARLPPSLAAAGEQAAARQNAEEEDAATPLERAAEAPPSDQPRGSGPARGDRGQAPAVLGETVRVDVDRLDVLLNLTGELVVSRARIAQLAGDVSPAFRKSGLLARTLAVAEGVRGLLGTARPAGAEAAELLERIEALEQQARAWDDSRLAFAELSTAIDQLSRVSNNLQRGVLNTRMVPVGPLFNRFKRSVRDIAMELGKRVHLELVGEKTELDKRMIDEIGDPLNHLIRNSIDHGIEPADVRIRHGKPEVANVRLTASHRGNNVFITVEDDGGGIDTARVKQIAIERGLLSSELAETLGDRELIDLIWQPGFSTAAKVSDISGRGVGMDIVRTKIAALNGTIEVDSIRGSGTRFTIRLPLTLTITRCMLFKLPQGVLAVPIENVREIVSVENHQSLLANGREMVDIRGEFLPLVRIEDLFHWPEAVTAMPSGSGLHNVVILTANGRPMGLRVDALLGGQDLVIKPIDENFTHIRGLGGASILGDGSVCLLLDVATCLEIIQQTPTAVAVA